MQVIMAFAQTNPEGTLMRPQITVHGSIAEAQEYFWKTYIPAINKDLQEDELMIEALDDDRIAAQINLTGTNTIDIDLEKMQVSVSIKVVA